MLVGRDEFLPVLLSTVFVGFAGPFIFSLAHPIKIICRYKRELHLNDAHISIVYVLA